MHQHHIRHIFVIVWFFQLNQYSCNIYLEFKSILIPHVNLLEYLCTITNTAKAACEGAFYNNGQSCCAIERIYVHEKAYDGFISAFLNEVGKYCSVIQRLKSSTILLQMTGTAAFNTKPLISSLRSC